MEELRLTVAKNISELRKNKSMTQLELAEMLNYSDKAVSKWERGESLPDVAVLKQIAELFGVSVDYLLEDEHKKRASDENRDAIDTVDPEKQKRNRLIISMLAASLVWLIATVIFVSLGLSSHVAGAWKAYICALPATFIVLLIFNSIWGRRRLNFAIISALVWTILFAIYIMLLEYNVWLIFVIGVPAQTIILLWSGLKK
ncbi:MAG: helix-turn-helix transcriptional regulator [Firmicutes bacterium]|nr:helix-turn-helix transcriptional regulator [Bacillota bacterium]